MKRRRIFVLCFVALLIFAAVPLMAGGGQQGAGGAQYRLRAATTTAAEHPMTLAVDDFIKLVEERSNGRFQITNYPHAILGEDRDLFAMVQDGTLDFALCSGSVSNTSRMYPALQLPFMFSNWEHYLEVMRSQQLQDFLDNFDIPPIKPLAIYNAGYRHLVVTGPPITNLSGFAGQKLRVAENPLHAAIFRALGASPTPLTYGEVYSALQNRLIDSLEMDLPAILLQRHYEVARGVQLTGHYTWPALFSVNKRLWDSFSPEDQRMLQQAALDVVAMNVETIQNSESDIIRELRRLGVSVTEPSPAFIIQMQQATRPVVEEYSGTNQYTRRLVDFAFSTQR